MGSSSSKHSKHKSHSRHSHGSGGASSGGQDDPGVQGVRRAQLLPSLLAGTSPDHHASSSTPDPFRDISKGRNERNQGSEAQYPLELLVRLLDPRDPEFRKRYKASQPQNLGEIIMSERPLPGPGASMPSSSSPTDPDEPNVGRSRSSSHQYLVPHSTTSKGSSRRSIRPSRSHASHATHTQGSGHRSGSNQSYGLGQSSAPSVGSKASTRRETRSRSGSPHSSVSQAGSGRYGKSPVRGSDEWRY